MPEEDVLITAKFYSEGEIWGVGTDEATLRAARKAAYAESVRKMLFEDGEGPDND